MNLEKFSGSGSTPSRRRFWDKLTEAVNASQKIAGHNVTIDEYPGKGSVINVPDGCCSSAGACCVDEDCSIQTEADCISMGGNYQGNGTSCDPNPCLAQCLCSLPSGGCPHAICFSFNPASQELSDGYWDSGYIVEMTDGSFQYVQAYAFIQSDGMGEYTASFFLGGAIGVTLQIDVPMTLAQFFDNWHQVSIQIDGESRTVTLCAYGVTDSTTYVGDIPNLSQLFVGSDAAFPGPVDIQIRDIKFLANPGSSEVDFIFPATGFDSSIGSGQSVSGDTVHVSSTDSAKNGYLKDLSPTWNMQCPCSDVCDFFTGITVITSMTGGDHTCEDSGSSGECDSPGPGYIAEGCVQDCRDIDPKNYHWIVGFYCDEDNHYKILIRIALADNDPCVDSVACSDQIFDIGVGDPTGTHVISFGDETCFTGSGFSFSFEVTVA